MAIFQYLIKWLRASVMLDVEQSSSIVLEDPSSSTITIDLSPPPSSSSPDSEPAAAAASCEEPRAKRPRLDRSSTAGPALSPTTKSVHSKFS